MSGTFTRLFQRDDAPSDPDTLGEDMVPSPSALAERSALAEPERDRAPKYGRAKPFSTAIAAPMRDFTG